MKTKGQLLLGVNIDHVATIRQARKTTYPDPVHAALEAQRAGADGITLHVREDRRHVNERDLVRMIEMCQIPVNLEMAPTDDMIDMCVKHKAPFCCLVPEKREELTTEGGLDVMNHFAKIKDATSKLQDAGTEVALFIEPSIVQIEAAFESGADSIEIHTGHFADAVGEKAQTEALINIEKATQVADDMGLKVNAGHGLHIHNVQAIARIPQIIELNIGHSIIAMSMIEGMYGAVSRFKQALESAR
jgi:pyridoxine 5-phosphate synthase